MYTYPIAISPICLFTGGSSDGGRAPAKRGKAVRPPGSRTSSRVPIKPRTTSDQPSTASGRGKSTGKRKKGKDAAPEDDLVEKLPEYNTATLHIAAWRRLRESNPYRFKERTYTEGDRLFWTETQGFFGKIFTTIKIL